MKKFSWILALIAALTMVFIGCPDGGGNNGGNADWADSPVTITDADEIGKLLVSTHLFNEKTGTAAENDDGVNVVSTDKNVAKFHFPDDGAIDNLGFRIAFPQSVIDQLDKKKKYAAMEVTFKLTKVTTLKTGEFAKIGFKEKAYYKKGDEVINGSNKTDMTPYADYELWFGTPTGGSVENGEGSEQTIKVPLYNPNKAPLEAIWFTHNKYKGESGPFNGKKGSDGPINYELTITKINFTVAIVKKDPKDSDFDVTNTTQYLADNKGNPTAIVAPSVTPKDGMDLGTVTLAYEGIDPVVAKSSSVPQTVGTFKILVSVTGSETFNTITDLNVGTLTIGVKAPAEKFKLSENTAFQAKEVGAKGNDVFVTGLQGAGGEFEVILVDGKKAIKLTTDANWNGLDLNDSHFKFAAGDRVTVTAKIASLDAASTSPEFLLQGKAGSWGPIGDNPAVTEGETITLDRTLTAADVANIKDVSYDYAAACIRIQLNNVGAVNVLEIHEIIILEGTPSVGTVTIATDPASAEPIVGVTLKATVEGEADVTYQWKLGGADIAGATSATFVTANAGAHTVVVSKTDFASATSNSIAILQTVNNFAITLKAPVKGETPTTAIDTHPQLTGVITWTADGVAFTGASFAPDTPYTASIVLAAKEGFSISSLTAETPFTINTVAKASYNPATKTVVSAAFAKTEAVEEGAVPVEFKSVTANGSPKVATTELTLTFDKAITGLAAADITLTAGTTGATKGTLSAPVTTETSATYTLPVTGITTSGEVTVAIAAKTGFEISGGSKKADVYKGGAAFEFFSFKGVTFTGNAGGDETEFFAGNYGIQRNGGTWAIEDGKLAFTYAAGSGNWKGIDIQVGTAAGGTNDYWNNTNGFAPTTGGNYKIIVVASADNSGAGKLRVQANQNYRDRIDLTLTSEPQTASFMWVQGEGPEAGKNFQLNNDDSEKGFIIHSIRIEEIPVKATAWEVADFTDEAISADGQYVGNLGLQVGNPADTSMEIDGATLVIKPTSGTYKSVTLQTGTAVSGTDNNAIDGFTAVAGKLYRITIKASVETTGQMRIRDGSRTGDNNWTGFDLTVTPTDYSHFWTQTTGNFTIDTGETPTGKGLIISSIKIVELE